MRRRSRPWPGAPAFRHPSFSPTSQMTSLSRIVALLLGPLFAIVSVAALPSAARAILDEAPLVCKCRYEAYYDEFWGLVLFGCYRETGQCLISCQEAYSAAAGYWTCHCDGQQQLCYCFGITQYAGEDPETTCVNVTCAGTGLVCREPTDVEIGAASGTFFLWCNCREPLR